MGFDPVSAALDIGGKLIDRLWPDPTEAAKAKLAMMQLQMTGELATMTADTDLAKAQVAVNQVEAGNVSRFVSWWRPAIGWICAGGLAYQVVLAPTVRLGAALCGYHIDLPAADPELDYVLGSLLGLTHVSRTVEKIVGVAAK